MCNSQQLQLKYPFIMYLTCFRTDKWDGEDEDDDIKDAWDAESDEEGKEKVILV